MILAKKIKFYASVNKNFKCHKYDIFSTNVLMLKDNCNAIYKINVALEN